jgi:outer membrane protein assembly factor BamB
MRILTLAVATCFMAAGCEIHTADIVQSSAPTQTDSDRLPSDTVQDQTEVDAALADPVSQPAAEDDWPMFRGNSLLTGVATSTLPDSLALLWTFQAEGKGESIESSAAIVNGVVYVGTVGGYLHAIGLNDGKGRWKYFTGNPDSPNPSAELPPAIKSSPTVAGGKVFFGDEVGVFHCLDAESGELLWKFDTATGAEIVSSANVIGDRVLFGSWDENLYCLSVADGKEVWKFKTGGPVNCTPAVIDNKTFLSGCDGQLRVVNIEDGSEVGSCEMESQTGASPAVVGDRLFVGHMGCQVLGINWRVPEIGWRYENRDRQFEYYSSAAATTEMVIVGGRDKMVHCLDPATGELRWTFPTRGRVDSSPVIVGTRVFVGSHDGNVYGLDVATGKEVWRFTAGGKLTASPAVGAERLVIGNDEAKVFCFGAKGK